MEYLFLLLFLFSLLALIIGLIKPSIVIRWGENKNRKNVLKYYGLSIILFVILSAITVPGLTVEDYIENAKEHTDQKEYEKAISDYQNALDDWEEEADYTFSKLDIKNELNKVEKNYSKILISDVEKALASRNIEKAENKLNETKKYITKNKKITELESKILKEKNKKEADEYLDQAEEYIEENKIEKASEEIIKASELIDDYNRITTLKNKIKGKLQILANDKLDKAEKELDDWNLTEAQDLITSAEDLSYDSSTVKELKNKLNEQKNIIADIGEKPENSEWDAAVRPVTKYLETHLKDPNSVEYIGWSPVHLCHVEGKPFWRVRAKYRAKNSFGGYVIEEKLFYMRHKQVVAVENY